MVLNLLSLYLLVSWYFGYRFFGDGESEWGWFLMGTSFAGLLGYGILDNYNYHWGITLGVSLAITIVSVLLIRKLNPWGEFFPHVPNKPLNVSDIPNWMFKLINRLSGYNYSEKLTNERKIHWKMTGWVVRHGTYGLVPFIALALAYQTIAPLFLSFFMGTGVALVYRKSFLNPAPVDKVKGSEMMAGFVCALTMVIGII